MTVRRVWSGSSFEGQAGYCRGVRVDNHIWVAATAPFNDDGSVAAIGSMKGQTRRCLEIIEAALDHLGAGMRHVVATRMFVTDITRAAELSDVHREFFSAHPPAASLVEVSALVSPEILIEIEAEAVVSDD